MVGNLVVILGDQLSLEISSLEKIKKNEDKILMMEVSNEIEYVNHHKKKLRPPQRSGENNSEKEAK